MIITLLKVAVGVRLAVYAVERVALGSVILAEEWLAEARKH